MINWIAAITPATRKQIKKSTMKIPTLFTGYMALTVFLLVLFSVTLPAWSDSQIKPSIKGAEKKEMSIKKGNDSKLNRKDSEDAGIDGSNKGESTVKRKIVKIA